MDANIELNITEDAQVMNSPLMYGEFSSPCNRVAFWVLEHYETGLLSGLALTNGRLTARKAVHVGNLRNWRFARRTVTSAPGAR